MSYSGIEQLVARLVHAQEVDGASPSPATKRSKSATYRPFKKYSRGALLKGFWKNRK